MIAQRNSKAARILERRNKIIAVVNRNPAQTRTYFIESEWPEVSGVRFYVTLGIGVSQGQIPVSYTHLFFGTAGQSFGAFLISGANFRLTGEANDYVGKGLCGGSIAITAHVEASERGDVLVGNTVLYGATSGELFVAGRAGERFAVRNSGALAVVEGVGRHGCEYMTAGVVVIVGPAGVNLGAGMTGGCLLYTSRCV